MPIRQENRRPLDCQTTPGSLALVPIVVATVAPPALEAVDGSPCLGLTGVGAITPDPATPAWAVRRVTVQ